MPIIAGSRDAHPDASGGASLDWRCDGVYLAIAGYQAKILKK